MYLPIITKKRLLISLTTTVIALLAICAVWGVANERVWDTYQETLASEEKAYTTLETHTTELQKLVVDEKSCASTGIDPQLCTQALSVLQEARDTKPAATKKLTHHILNLPSHINFVKTETTKHQQHKETITAIDKKVQEQIAILTETFLKKATSDYEAQVEHVKASITALNQLIADTDGKVTDNATREAATTAIKDAQSIIDTKVDLTSLDTLREHTQKLIEQANILSEKSTAVSTSRDAWQAEQEAQAAAAAAAEQAHQAASNNTYSGNSYSSSSSSSGGNSYDAPVTWDNSGGHDNKVKDGFIPYG